MKRKIIKGFKAVDFMRQERDRIGKETQDMNFAELQEYFTGRRTQTKFIPHRDNN